MRRGVLAAVLLSGAMAEIFAEEASPKKRVAVFDFEHAAVQAAPSIPFLQPGAPPDLGKVVADLLVNRLVLDGSCSVIERKALDKLIAEQNLSNSDRTAPESAAKLGRLLGVDAIVLGSLTHYDLEDKQTGGPGGGFGGFGRSMNTKHDMKVLVQISARIVSPDTAEVVSVAQGTSDAFRKGVKISMTDKSAIFGGQGGVGDTMLKETLDKAVVQLAGNLVRMLAKLPPRAARIEGLVADSNPAGRLILNVGSVSGVKVGDRLQVWKAGKPVRDPETQKVLRYDDTLLGEAVVTGVEEISSVAAYTGAEQPKPGDRVKSFPKQP